MPTDAQDRPSARRPQARIARWSAVLVLGAVAVGCSSTRGTSGSTPVTTVAGGGAPGIAASSTQAQTTGTPETTPPSTEPPSTVAEPTTTVEPTTTTTSPPTTTTAPLVTAGAKVIVANATNVPGGAGRLTQELTKVGYTLGDPTNAAGNEEFLDATKVYFLPDGEAVATGLATVLGVALARMPTPAPITDATAGLGDATVLVMLGKDLAGKTPPGLKGR